MIQITVFGARMAHDPEVRLVRGDLAVCEFRVLDSRWTRDGDVTEAVTFCLWGEEAENFASKVIKGQEVTVTGLQETSYYTPPGGEKKTYVKYRVVHWIPGRKPSSARQQNGQDSNAGGYNRPANGSGGYQPPPRQPAQQQAPREAQRYPQEHRPHPEDFQNSGFGEHGGNEHPLL